MYKYVILSAEWATISFLWHTALILLLDSNWLIPHSNGLSFLDITLLLWMNIFFFSHKTRCLQSVLTVTANVNVFYPLIKLKFWNKMAKFQLFFIFYFFSSKYWLFCPKIWTAFSISDLNLFTLTFTLHILTFFLLQLWVLSAKLQLFFSNFDIVLIILTSYLCQTECQTEKTQAYLEHYYYHYE